MKCIARVFAALIVFSLLLSAGCGEQAPAGTIVRGKIYKGGAPIKAQGDFPEKMITFIATFEENYNDIQSIGDDGSFEMAGQGNGLKPGKYKIAVAIKADYSAPDQLKEKFSEEKTPIVREVNNSGVQDLGIIDLDNPN